MHNLCFYLKRQAKHYKTDWTPVVSCNINLFFILIDSTQIITLDYCSKEAKLIVRVYIDLRYSKLCIVRKKILQIYSSLKHKVSLSTELDLPIQTSDSEILACKIDTFLLLFQSCPITKALIIWKRNVPFWDTFLLHQFFDQSSLKKRT